MKAAGATAAAEAVTIVTQTRVRPESTEAFALWQETTSRIVASFPGFLEQTVLPPSPPQQVDWVILQRFCSSDAALGWLNSPERRERVDGIASMLVGPDDVHVVKDGGQGALPAPVSVVISTRLKPGQEAVYRRWEQRIAAAQARAPGFQGYRFEPPTPGVQDDWLSILRFDTEAHLQAWLDSPERHALLEEADAFTERYNARIVRTGFDQWFPPAAGGAPPIPAWKMNMVVLLLLYPIVVLFGAYIQTPLLSGKLGLPFPIALFIGNVVSVILLTYAVPWTSRGLDWWLGPGKSWRHADLAGAALLVGLYGVMLFLFTRFF